MEQRLIRFLSISISVDWFHQICPMIQLMYDCFGFKWQSWQKWGPSKIFAFVFFSVLFSKKKTGTGLIYLHLQKVVELLTRGWKGLRSAELKVPQLVLCSERKKTTRTAKGPGREESFYPYQNLHSRSILFLLCIISYILSTWKHRENHSIRE